MRAGGVPHAVKFTSRIHRPAASQLIAWIPTHQKQRWLMLYCVLYKVRINNCLNYEIAAGQWNCWHGKPSSRVQCLSRTFKPTQREPFEPFAERSRAFRPGYCCRDLHEWQSRSAYQLSGCEEPFRPASWKQQCSIVTSSCTAEKE